MTKIYHQLQEIELLEPHLAAMQTYLRRKQVNKSYRRLYNNFVIYLQKKNLVNHYDREAVD